MIYALSIPCGEDDLKVHEHHIANLKPKEISGYEAYFSASDRIIQADLTNPQRPIYLEQVANLAQLTPCKVYKTLEILFRQNTKEAGDRHDKRAEYFAQLYRAELQAVTLVLSGGARVRRPNKVVRC